MVTLTFSKRDRELFVNGTDVSLTKREWQVVTALRDRGRLTDAELGAVVWLAECAGGTAYSGEDFRHLVRFHIWGLRAKGVPISNRRGLGYKLEGQFEVQHE